MDIEMTDQLPIAVNDSYTDNFISIQNDSSIIANALIAIKALLGN